jgi:prevent-host-death family protein
MSVTNIHQAKTNLSKLIEAAERGEEVIIARNGKPVAAIVPIAPPSLADGEKDTPGKRIEGIWAGKVVVNDPDWWKNDDEFIELFYDVSKFSKNPDAA